MASSLPVLVRHSVIMVAHKTHSFYNYIHEILYSTVISLVDCMSRKMRLRNLHTEFKYVSLLNHLPEWSNDREGPMAYELGFLQAQCNPQQQLLPANKKNYWIYVESIEDTEVRSSLKSNSVLLFKSVLLDI